MTPFVIITEILTEKFDVDRSLITRDATFETLELDSLSQVELGTTLRKKLGIVVSDNELQDIETMQDLENLITAKLK